MCVGSVAVCPTTRSGNGWMELEYIVCSYLRSLEFSLGNSCPETSEDDVGVDQRMVAWRQSISSRRSIKGERRRCWSRLLWRRRRQASGTDCLSTSVMAE